MYLVLFLISSTLIQLFTRNKVTRQKRLSFFISFLCKSFLKHLTLKLKVQGLEHLKTSENYLIVANHVSYIDIFLLHVPILNSRFISHTGNGFLLTSIARNAGSYFIKRDFTNIRKELREATNILKQGLNLVLFPEGTNTDGSSILPFHSLFFNTAIYARKQVLPTRIRYTKVNGEDFGPQNRNLICWHLSEISFMKHLVSFLQLQSVEATIEFLLPLSSEGMSSRSLAEKSRNNILKD